METIILGSPSTGLGDILLLTSVCKHLLKTHVEVKVELPHNKERFAHLFEGLAQVEFRDECCITPDIGGGHYATRKLRHFFGSSADDLDNRPLVLYSDPESERWVSEYLKNKPHPVIFVSTCAKQWDSVRSMPRELAEMILEMLKDAGFTPILCSSSENVMELNCQYQLTDLPLAKYICLLRRAGHYVGCNTGDMHLAVAVGAKTEVFQPLDHPLFNESEWNYKHPTINYSHFQ
jgi:ADP-heptose:LPS heptosyltransferase